MLTEHFAVPENPGRLSDLFRILQEISGHAVSACHLSGPELKEKGLMWVVIRYELTLSRALCPGEDLVITTWPSPVRHRMSQRSYLLADAGGRSLGQAAGVWALVDRETRSMVDGAARGVQLPTEETGLEPPFPAPPEKLPAEGERIFTVSDEWLDINGHMNNTRYFDVAQACIGSEADGLTLLNARASFQNEVLAGDELTVSFGRRDGLWAFSGGKSGAACFQLSLRYTS